MLKSLGPMVLNGTLSRVQAQLISGHIKKFNKEKAKLGHFKMNSCNQEAAQKAQKDARKLCKLADDSYSKMDEMFRNRREESLRCACLQPSRLSAVRQAGKVLSLMSHPALQPRTGVPCRTPVISVVSVYGSWDRRHAHAADRMLGCQSGRDTRTSFDTALARA
ncbi:hypothetical protein DPEC_G00361550 [Dallia pectoralis]|nr:hypothetical protein DPEC_G00361550 [Dallia pectoralis]